MDDDNDKGRKTNTERDYKPEGASRKGYAPRGVEGRPAASGPSPGLGTSTSGRINFKRSQEVGRSTASDQPQTQSQAQDGRAYTIATGDEAVDKQAAETDRVISREEAEKMIGREKVARHMDEKSQKPDRGASLEGPKRSQSNFARAFQQSGGPGKSRNRDQGLE